MIKELKLIKVLSGVNAAYFKTYRTDFIFGTLQSIIAMTILIFLWSNIYSSEMVVVYFVIYYLLQLLLSSYIAWDIADDIRSGNIALQLTKPISYKKKLLYEQFGATKILFVYLCLPILAILGLYIRANGLSIELTIFGLTVLLLNMAMSYLFFFYIEVLVGIMTFYITYIFGIVMLKSSVIVLLTGGYIPIFALPESLQTLYTFTPFYYLFYFPIELISGALTNKEMLLGLVIQLIWLLIFVQLVNRFYNKSIKHIEVAGG